ncbi:MAG: AraC family transcriptional regulator [Lachnospiraceae bacterium]|nr:AraC family transcriptional regulator [Lachnospiraceae bacterium]
MVFSLVRAYIKQRRLEHAKTLLSTTDTTIEQVSKAVGYSNAGRFANDFKKVTNLYPVEYRKTISGGRNK